MQQERGKEKEQSIFDGCIHRTHEIFVAKITVTTTADDGIVEATATVWCSFLRSQARASQSKIEDAAPTAAMVPVCVMKTMLVGDVIPTVGKLHLDILRVSFLIGDANGTCQGASDELNQRLQWFVIALKQVEVPFVNPSCRLGTFRNTASQGLLL